MTLRSAEELSGEFRRLLRQIDSVPMEEDRWAEAAGGLGATASGQRPVGQRVAERGSVSVLTPAATRALGLLAPAVTRALDLLAPLILILKRAPRALTLSIAGIGGVTALASAWLLLAGRPDASPPRAGMNREAASPGRPRQAVPAEQAAMVSQSAAAVSRRAAAPDQGLPTAEPPPPNTASLGAVPPVKLGDAESLDEQSQDRLLRQGLRLLIAGSISSARLLFQRAAEAGNARAALLLGDTYDNVRLAQMGVQGVLPDKDKASYWYERADELGAVEGKERLSEINGR